MANILVAVGVVEGHFYPTYKVVEQLVKRGHDILWWAGSEEKAKIEAIGARYIKMPDEYDPKGLPYYEFRPEIAKLKGLKQIKYYVKHEFLDLSEFVLEMYSQIESKFRIDLILSDPVMWPIYFLAEKLRVPSVNLHVIPLLTSSEDTAPFGTALRPAKQGLRKRRNQFLNFLTNEILLRDLMVYGNAKRKLFGLPPFDKKHRDICNAMLSIPDRVLYTTVPSFEYDRSDNPNVIEFIGPIVREFDDNYKPPEWWTDLNSDIPVIVVNQGTMISDPSDLILPTIEALRNEKCIVIAVPVTTDIGELPSNVRTARFIPFGNLLPLVDIFITNGGYGGTHMALAQGVPIIVAGEQDDKMEIAARISWAGCGINLRRKSPKPQKIKEAVKTILRDGTYRKNAENFQQTIQSYNPIEVSCNVIEEEIAKITSKGTA